MSATTSATLPVLREDLSDEVAMIDYENTLFTSTVRVGKPATHSEYAEVADLPQQGRLGGKAESRAIDRATVQDRFLKRAKIKGIVQEKVEDYGVTDRTKKVENPAGITDVSAEAYARAVESFKQGIEMTALSQQRQQDDAYVMNEKGDMETQHLTQGASAWCDASPIGDSDLLVPAAYRPASAQNVLVTALTDFTETSLRSMLQAKRTAAHANVDSMVFCTFDFQTHVDTFFDEKAVDSGKAHIRSFNYDGGAPMFEVGLKGYKTTFGKIMMAPTGHLNATREFGAVDAAGAARSLSVTTTNTSTTVTVDNTRGLQPFMHIKATGIPAGAYIASITNTTTFVISSAATASATVTATLGKLDHALFLEMKYFQKKTNGGVEDVDLSPEGNGDTGFVRSFFSIFCGLPLVQGKVHQA